MDYLQQFTSQFRNRLLVILLINDLVTIGILLLIQRYLTFTGFWLIVPLAIVIIWLIFCSLLSASYLLQPTKMIWQAILHIAPDVANVPAPKPDKAPFGKELINSLSNQIYQIATQATSIDLKNKTKRQDLHHDYVVANLPLPVFVLDKQQNIAFANFAALQYIGKSDAETIDKNFYSLMDLEFDDSNTLDTWLAEARDKSVTAFNSWDRVQLKFPNGNDPVMFDLAVYYNRDNPMGYETILILFDHTKKYSEAQKELGFVAMAVHELRTPLTLLRGYIEALEENLSSSISDENNVLLQRMEASAHQLSTFINNVLNVARIEDDQFVVQLHQESWANVIQTALDDMRLQASVRGISISSEIAENLPPVGVDRVSMYEVITNLIGNAIKYSGDSKKVALKAYLNSEGLVETTIQDYGVGIPDNIMPNLFSKFYRSHRSRNSVGGTGLGLYISKIIIDAHGGNVWVRSKEGEGTTFGFTVLPFSKLDSSKQTREESMTRVAHGWIKNHSLYRR